MSDIIQIKRSITQDSPGTLLQPGELAYSYLSRQLYIGSAEPNGAAIPIISSAPQTQITSDYDLQISIQIDKS